MTRNLKRRRERSCGILFRERNKSAFSADSTMSTFTYCHCNLMLFNNCIAEINEKRPKQPQVVYYTQI